MKHGFEPPLLLSYIFTHFLPIDQPLHLCLSPEAE
jgi:hypothetical protein